LFSLFLPALFSRCPQVLAYAGAVFGPRGGPLPPGWCGWHPGFPSGMFHLFPSPLGSSLFRWLFPPPLAWCRWSLVVIKSRWLRWLSAPVPPLLSPCYVFFFGSVLFFSWFGSVFIL
ncbi:hypothetical protein GQ42DRAFT_165443, partial [Ramicandelaber brevisporus]